MRWLALLLSGCSADGKGGTAACSHDTLVLEDAQGFGFASPTPSPRRSSRVFAS